MKEITISPPLNTTTKGGLRAVVEYVRPNDRLDMFRGTIEVNEFGAEKEVTWGVSGNCRDHADICNLTKDSLGFIELQAKYLRR